MLEDPTYGINPAKKDFRLAWYVLASDGPKSRGQNNSLSFSRGRRRTSPYPLSISTKACPSPQRHPSNDLSLTTSQVSNSQRFSSYDVAKPKPILSSIILEEEEEDVIIRRSFMQTMVFYGILALALGGLIWQIGDITTLYFKYETVTVLRVIVPENVTCPALSVCFPYDNLINREKLSKVAPNLDQKKEIKLADLQNFTISEIFRMTPEVTDSVIKSCYFRNPGNFTRQQKVGDCMKITTVTKFYKQQFMCYKFSIINSSTNAYNYEYIQNPLISPGMFYEMTLKLDFFKPIEYFQTIIHEPELSPRGNKAYPVILSRVAAIIPIDGKEIKLYDNFFSISYAFYMNALLKAPYSTDCIDYESIANLESQEHCADECMTAEITKFLKKIPFTAVHLKQYNMSHVSKDDISDPKIAKHIFLLRTGCLKKCKRSNCNDNVYVTKFIRSYPGDYLTLRVYVTNEPVLECKYKPKMSSIELAIYVLSCFGIWFGISFYAIASLARRIILKSVMA